MYTDLTVLMFLLIGVTVATVVGILPGLGGPFGIVLLLPIAFRVEFELAVAMLMAATVVSGTANTMTSVLFGVPGSPTGVATVLDGYPMSKRGEGARAVSAGLTASFFGGVIGAVFLILMLPIMREVVLLLGPSEFLAIIVAAMVLIASVGKGDTVKDLIAGCLGVLLALVGLSIATGAPRFTFGQLYLWDGIKVAPFMIGLFAITEMFELARKRGSIVEQAKGSPTKIRLRGQVVAGIADTVKRPITVLLSSVTGLWVGMAPGLGAVAGQFIAYSQTVRLSKTPEVFGEGAVEGVIGAEAATNSVDAGALIPTLAFGIPGNIPFAILVSVFLSFGLRPGPEMLTVNRHIVWFMIFSLVVANFFAVILSMSVTPLLARLTFVRTTYLVPPILVVSIAGAYATSAHIGDVVTAFAIGFLGVSMKALGYSRLTFVIGFVLGGLLERYLILSHALYGWSFVVRPITASLLLLALGLLVLPIARSRLKKDRQRDRNSGARHRNAT